MRRCKHAILQLFFLNWAAFFIFIAGKATAQSYFQLFDTIETNLKALDHAYDFSIKTDGHNIFYKYPLSPDSCCIIKTNLQDKQKRDTVLKFKASETDHFNDYFVCQNKIILCYYQNTEVYDYWLKAKTVTFNLTTNYIFILKQRFLVMAFLQNTSVLNNRPELHLWSYDLKERKEVTEKHILFTGIQYAHLASSNFLGADSNYLYYTEPLGRQIYKFNFNLKCIDSISTQNNCSNCSSFESKLSNLNQQELNIYDSMRKRGISLNEIKSALHQKIAREPKAMIYQLLSNDTILERRIEKITILDSLAVISYVSKKNKTSKQNEFDVINLNNKKTTYSKLLNIHQADTSKAFTVSEFNNFRMTCDGGLNCFLHNGSYYVCGSTKSSIFDKSDKRYTIRQYQDTFKTALSDAEDNPTIKIVCYKFSIPK